MMRMEEMSVRLGIGFSYQFNSVKIILHLCEA